MPVKSKAQAGLMGAVISGKARRKTGLTQAEAREHLRGSKLTGLPKRKGQRRMAGKGKGRKDRGGRGGGREETPRDQVKSKITRGNPGK